MKIYIIIKDIYIISRLKNIINNDNLFYFQNIDEAYNFIIEHGMPNILIYEYSKENEKIITLSQYLDTPLFYSIVLFNYFNETLIKNHLQNYYGDFFILSNNINELGLHILQIINNYYYKYTINKDITFNELNNTISDGIHTIKFTKLQYNLFRYLFLKTNQIVTRKEIQLSVWGFDEYDIFSRSIDTHIKLIRKKLNQYPLFKYKILTVRGKGYSLISNMLKHIQIE
jgi:DNA-binding winged helix-turn-helix (wHTH) protein